MSRKCRAYSESKLGLEPADNRKAFYAGWDAAMAQLDAVVYAKGITLGGIVYRPKENEDV